MQVIGKMQSSHTQLLDLLAQLAPTDTAQAASGRELPYVLLRRAGKYEVRRYPQHVAVCDEPVEGRVRRPAHTPRATDRVSSRLPSAAPTTCTRSRRCGFKQRLAWSASRLARSGSMTVTR